MTSETNDRSIDCIPKFNQLLVEKIKHLLSDIRDSMINPRAQPKGLSLNFHYF